MKSFIDLFIEYTSDKESPTSFFCWSAYAVVAAVMRDNCWLQWGLASEILFPNLYVLLLAKSSVVRKNSPIKLAERLVKDIGNTKVISGSASMQGAVKILSEATTSPTGKQLTGAACFLCATELSSFMVDDPKTVDILMEWYDYHKVWDFVRVNSGSTRLRNVCVTLLAASNEVLLKDVYDVKAVAGGLLARTLVVWEDKRRHKNSLMYIDAKEDNYKELLVYLTNIAGNHGKMEMTIEAKNTFHNWYTTFDDESIKTTSGIEGRLGADVLKVAMIMSAAELNFPVIEKDHIENAIDICTSLVKNYNRVAVGAGHSSPIAEPAKAVFIELLRAPKYTITRRDILRHMWGDVDPETLGKVIDTFRGGGLVYETIKGSDVIYTLTQDAIDQYTNKTKKGTKP